MAKLLNNQTIISTSAKAASDFKKSRYIGFNSSNSVKNFKLYDIELVKQDLLNHFHIRKGEKLENPTFGTNIYDMLFENFTSDVKASIIKDVETVINHDPRVSVQRLDITNHQFGIIIEADLLFLEFDLVDHMKIVFDRNNNI